MMGNGGQIISTRPLHKIRIGPSVVHFKLARFLNFLTFLLWEPGKSHILAFRLALWRALAPMFVSKSFVGPNGSLLTLPVKSWRIVMWWCDHVTSLASTVWHHVTCKVWHHVIVALNEIHIYMIWYMTVMLRHHTTGNERRTYQRDWVGWDTTLVWFLPNCLSSSSK